MSGHKQGKKDSQNVSRKDFRFYKKCKLPSCHKEFGTNREWQDFCPDSGHQQEYHRLLRRKHEDVIVEIELLKEKTIHLEDNLQKALDQFCRYKNWLHKQFQLGGTPIELNQMIKEIKDKLPKEA